MNYSLSHIASFLPFVEQRGTAQPMIDWLVTDSRTLTFPETTLFFAISSPYRDAHQFIPKLYARGVRAFVVEHCSESLEKDCPEATFLVVQPPHTTLEALQTIARMCRREFTGKEVLGITGSNGKTIVKEWIYQLISPNYNVVRSPRSYNSQVGVPLSVALLSEETEVGIFEAGISQVGEMDTLRSIIAPTIGLLTHIGDAHQENFASKAQKVQEKLRLFATTKAFIYGQDDETVATCVKAMQSEGYAGMVYGWSGKDANAPLYVSATKTEGGCTTIRYYITENLRTALHFPAMPAEGYTAQIPFTDAASIENAITAFFASFLFFGLTPDTLTERLLRLEPVAMRLEVKQGSNNCTIINDAYNSDITSLEIALNFMERRPVPMGYRRMVILSDILQSGLAIGKINAIVAQLLEKHQVDTLVTVGTQWEDFKEHLKGQITLLQFESTGHLLRSSVLRALERTIVLVKGARIFGFERIVERLSQRVHETTLEIDLEAVGENLNFYRSFLQAGTKMVCMIKASAYGAGAVEVAKTLEDRGVDYLAVAVADEGAELRKAGVKSNIIIMNPEMSSFDLLFQYRLEPEVYSFGLLKALHQAAKREGITNFPIHIKLDTGMSRLGFNPEADMPALINYLHAQKALIPRSVFSHFAGSDSQAFDDFSAEQFRRFDQASQILQKAFPHKILRHICNSAGIERFPERHLDMVRLGLGLYGIDPIDNRTLHTVATLRTTILQIRNIEATTTVGYSRRGKLQRPSRIAAIPIGYADGLNRHLGNGKAYCLVNGERAPYVGNICMDICMIDVTDINCQEGDVVEIFGKNLPVTVLSEKLDTIPYEVLTGISERVKRVYVQ